MGAAAKQRQHRLPRQRAGFGASDDTLLSKGGSWVNFQSWYLHADTLLSAVGLCGRSHLPQQLHACDDSSGTKPVLHWRCAE